MKIKSIVGNLLTITLMLGLSQSVFAGSNDRGPPAPDSGEPPCDLSIKLHADHECRAQLATVFYTIGGADSVYSRDESKLQSKVCAADSKLHVEPVAKTDDAVQKLQDIIDTVNSKRKISPADAADIADDAYDAQTCIDPNLL
jgi:hypothetical protein